MSSSVKFQNLLRWIEKHEDIVPPEFHDINEFGRFHKPVCVRCQIGMMPYENGVWIIDTFMDPPQPYQIWSADMWICPICEHKVINGFSNNATQHHQDGFARILEMAKEGLHVYSFEHVHDAANFIAVNSQDLVPGKSVDIYQRPLTAEEYEGRAILKEKLSKGDILTQRWIVEFDDGMVVERHVHKHHANARVEW